MADETGKAPEAQASEPMTWRHVFQPRFRVLATRFGSWDAMAKRSAAAVVGSGFAEWAAIVAAVATVGVAFFTAYQIWVDLDDRKEERAERIAERIERAYGTLTRRMSGDIGKGAALTLLVRNNVPLGDLDLSCEAVGRWNDKEKRCEKRPVFNELKMYDENAESTLQINDRLPDLHDTAIGNSDLRYVMMGQGKTNGVEISDTDMRSARIADKGLVISNSDFSRGVIMPDADDISFNTTNISGVGFMAITWRNDDGSKGYDLGTSYVSHNASWYWSDMPPYVVDVRRSTNEPFYTVPIKHEDLKGLVLRCDARDRRDDDPESHDVSLAWRPFRRFETSPKLKRISSIALQTSNTSIHSKECYETFKAGNIFD